jgi:hypothetical protein
MNIWKRTAAVRATLNVRLLGVDDTVINIRTTPPYI